MTLQANTTHCSNHFYKYFLYFIYAFCSNNRILKFTLSFVFFGLCSCTTRSLTSSFPVAGPASAVRLAWGQDAQMNESITAPLIRPFLTKEANSNARAQAKRSCAKMAEESANSFQAISQFHFENTLPSTEEYKASLKAKNEVE